MVKCGQEVTMTVAQLIAALREMPQDAPVWVDSGGDAFDECGGVTPEPIGVFWMGGVRGPLVMVHTSGRTTHSLTPDDDLESLFWHQPLTA
jgi:hypothetical protein